MVTTLALVEGSVVVVVRAVARRSWRWAPDLGLVRRRRTCGGKPKLAAARPGGGGGSEYKGGDQGRRRGTVELVGAVAGQEVDGG